MKDILIGFESQNDAGCSWGIITTEEQLGTRDWHISHNSISFYIPIRYKQSVRFTVIIAKHCALGLEVTDLIKEENYKGVYSRLMQLFVERLTFESLGDMLDVATQVAYVAGINKARKTFRQAIGIEQSIMGDVYIRDTQQEED